MFYIVFHEIIDFYVGPFTTDLEAAQHATQCQKAGDEAPFNIVAASNVSPEDLEEVLSPEESLAAVQNMHKQC